MKKINLIIGLTFLSILLNAQTRIKGRLINNENEPIPFATVAIMKGLDSTILKGNYTAEDGTFEFEKIQPGNYYLKAMVIGMDTKTSPSFEIKDTQNDLVLKDLIVEKSGLNLQSVEIVAIKPLIEFKNGNTIINVDNSILASGNTAYDLLKKAPGVTIDNNNNLAIQGKQGVKIMIDGRMQQLSTEQLANLLQSMTAEGIDKIEIMKNPSVKYDAEGTSGIIQIKTKKAKLLGYNGSATVGVSQGALLGGNGGISLNYKGQKYAVTSSLNGTSRNRRKELYINRKIKTNADDLIFEQNNIEKNNNQAMDYKLGADWYVSDKTTLGVMLDGGIGTPNSNSTNNTVILGNNTVGFDNLASISDINNSWNNNNLNLNLVHKIDTIGGQLDASFDYTMYQENGKNYYGNYFKDALNNQVVNMLPNIYRNNILSDINMLIGALNFKKALANKVTFETGLKYSGVNTDNSLLFERKEDLNDNFYNDSNYSNSFSYKENVGAGYVNFQKEFSKLSMQIGLRAEYTNATGFNKTILSKINREYLQLFPNVSLDFNQSENHTFQISYNRRINRPDYFQLNPFKFYLDQYTASEGNPFLNPETSHNMNFSHTFKGNLNNSISYSRTENAISELTVQDDNTKETKQITRNIKASNMLSYNLFASIPIKKWYSVQVDLSGWYQNFEGEVNGVNFNKGKPAMQLNITNEIILPKEFSLEISGQYTSSMLWGIFEIKPRGNVDIGIKKMLLKNKVSIKLSTSDIFRTAITRVDVNFDNQNINLSQYQDTRRVNISFTYNFGNAKFRLNGNKSSNNAEKNRLKRN